MITRPDPDNNKTTKIVLINFLCSRLHKVLFENHIFYEKVSSIKIIIITIRAKSEALVNILILVIAIAKCQRAKILPILARC